jgi:Trk K+ transport system NAD-binding subunit
MLLDSESIDETDMFLALTNDEEDNIMSASWPSAWAPVARWR